jgi:plastocyanin
MKSYSQGQASGQQPSWDAAKLILTASGVPTDGGRLKWPLGLRLLGPLDGGPLRDRTEALLQVAALQAQVGKVNPQLKREVSKAVGKLRARLRALDDRAVLARFTVKEAERFLDRVKRAPKLIEQAMPAPGGSYPQLRATASSVTLSDNSFQPRTITVPAGGTVQWTNRGSHAHTVASNDGRWGSGKLDPGAVYRQTFARPGTYPYYCKLHPREMRGVVIVKGVQKK